MQFITTLCIAIGVSCIFPLLKPCENGTQLIRKTGPSTGSSIIAAGRFSIFERRSKIPKKAGINHRLRL